MSIWIIFHIAHTYNWDKMKVCVDYLDFVLLLTAKSTQV